MMAYKNIYAIGDVQGCYHELQTLLELIKFDLHSDQLWFVGDLVNRGPHSLEVLRLVYSLGEQAISVLGNHDLHLLAVAAGSQPLKVGDTLNDILGAPDRDKLLAWLAKRPLLHHDAALGYTLVHAGIPPQWSIHEAVGYAHEVETALQNNQLTFLQQLYGNEPSEWCNDLSDIKRLRYIVNALSRMRFCTKRGKLHLASTDKVNLYPQKTTSTEPNLSAWFSIAERQTINDKIIFGHWAALGGKTNTANVFALDTGCVWGKALTAMRLHDHCQFSVAAHQ